MAAQSFRELTKARDKLVKGQRLTIMKSDDDKRLVFGWASVAVRVDGEQIIDLQQDAIDPDELEKAAYKYVAEFGTAGEMHQRGGIGRVVESCVFTKEKAQALGIPAETLPEGWWIGFHITDDDVWEKIKSGEYNMFSIGGKGVREPMGEGGDS